MSLKVFSVRDPVSDSREDHEHRESGGHSAAVGPLYDHCHTRTAGPRPLHSARHLLHVHPQKPSRFLPGNAAGLGHGSGHSLQVTVHRQERGMQHASAVRRVTNSWSKVHINTLHNLYVIAREIKLRTIRWAGHVARMWDGNSKCLTNLILRLLMSYIYIYMEHLFLMFLDHTQRRTTVGRTPLDE